MRGMEIDSIVYGSPADTMGVTSNWSICEVNGQILNAEEIQEVLNSNDPFTITFQVYIFDSFSNQILIFESQPQKEREVMLFRTGITDKKDKKIQIRRKQFPVRLTYAMTINKAQGNQINFSQQIHVFI